MNTPSTSRYSSAHPGGEASLCAWAAAGSPHDAARLNLLAETASQLLRSKNPQAVVEQLCQKVLAHLDCQVFFNFLVDEAQGRLHLNACAGIPPEEVLKLEWLDYGVAVCGCAARDGCRIIAENIRATPDPRTDLVKSYGVQAYACHPLVSQDQILGTLSFGTRTRTHFTADEISLMKAVADHVAIAMVRCQTEAQLRQMNAELERRVQERTADLQAANRELEAFCYSISHDLRAPLRAVSGFSQNLAEDYRPHLDDAGQDMLQRITNGCAKMGNLIDDLLNLSRLSRAQMRPRLVDLTQVAREVVKELQQADPARSIDVRIAEGLTAMGDAGLLRASLANLLGNAWKFSSRQPDARIEFGQRRNGEAPLPPGAAAPSRAPVFFVRDNGAGFDMKYADKLFAPFQRLHANADFAGTGIGLAIVQRVVHRHGGMIWFDAAPNQGATFYFTLEQGS